MNQRWAQGRESYRPPAERIVPSEYEVAELLRDTEPRAFIAEHHYLGTYPSARFRYGLFRRGQLVGVAVFSYPTNTRSMTNVFPDTGVSDLVTLGRFCLLDEVPGMGETWFLRRIFRTHPDALTAKGIRGVVSFSDPLRREDVSGRMVCPGHVGTIYQAFNGAYLGRSRAESKWLMPDGSTFHRERVTKIRYRRQGWEYGVRSLVAAGASEPWSDSPAELSVWVDEFLPRIARRVLHPGNHKYAWALHRGLRCCLAFGPYPKKVA